MRAAPPVLAALTLVACSSTAVLDVPVAAQPPPVTEAGSADTSTPDAAWPAVDAGLVCHESARFTFNGDGNWYGDGTEATDSKTGLVWRREAEGATATYAPKLCEARGYRHPTVKELLGLVLKPGECVPALDDRAFRDIPHGGIVYASDGCVDMAKGKESPPPCVDEPTIGVHTLCVRP